MRHVARILAMLASVLVGVGVAGTGGRGAHRLRRGGDQLPHRAQRPRAGRPRGRDRGHRGRAAACSSPTTAPPRSSCWATPTSRTSGWVPRACSRTSARRPRTSTRIGAARRPSPRGGPHRRARMGADLLRPRRPLARPPHPLDGRRTTAGCVERSRPTADRVGLGRPDAPGRRRAHREGHHRMGAGPVPVPWIALAVVLGVGAVLAVWAARRSPWWVIAVLVAVLVVIDVIHTAGISQTLVAAVAHEAGSGVGEQPAVAVRLDVGRRRRGHAGPAQPDGSVPRDRGPDHRPGRRRRATSASSPRPRCPSPGRPGWPGSWWRRAWAWASVWRRPWWCWRSATCGSRG